LEVAGNLMVLISSAGLKHVLCQRLVLHKNCVNVMNLNDV